MARIVLGEKYNDQIKRTVRYVERQPRGDSDSGTRNPFRMPQQYIMHDVLTDVTTTGTASAMIHSAFTTAQVVLTESAEFKLVIAGASTAIISPTADALTMRSKLQPLMPGVDFSVHAFSGRWIIACTSEDSPNLASIEMHADYLSYGYAQKFHSTRGADVEVLALSATSVDNVSAGNLCVGFPMRSGTFVIPECRTYTGTTVTPTTYDPPGGAAWTAVTFGACTLVANYIQQAITTEPTSGATLEFKFANDSIVEVPSTRWSWVSGGGGVLTVSFLLTACDWSEFSVVSGPAPSGSPTHWREQA